MSLLLIVFWALVVAILIRILITIAQNQVALQFFKINSPNLPVIPNPKLLGGHMNEISFNKRNWQVLDCLHRHYGKTFGFYFNTMPVASTIDLDLIKAVVLDQPDANVNRVRLGGPIEEFEYDTISQAEDDQWRRLRRAIAPAFSLHKIKSANVQAEFKSVIDKFVASIDRRLSRAKEERNEDFIVEDAEDIFHRYALALVFTCFYKQDNMVDFDSDKDAHIEMIENAFKNFVNLPLKFCLWFPSLRPIMSFLVGFHPLGKLRTRILGYIRDQTKLNLAAKKQLERMKQQGKENFDEDNFLLQANKQKFSRNLIDYIIDRFHEGMLSPAEYLHSSFFLFFAADKTSADSMSKLIYHLACHQDVQEKLRQSMLLEGTESEYLSWVLNESMRLFPPTLIGCSRMLSHDIRDKNGLLIPKGTLILTPPWSIHRSTEYWGQDANEFKPERWAEAKSFHPAQNLTFGLGKRACPGKDFALAEVKLLMDFMLKKYKFERCSKTPDSIQFTAPDFIFTIADVPTYIKISPLTSVS